MFIRIQTSKYSWTKKNINNLDNKFNVNDYINLRILKRIFQIIDLVILNFINYSLNTNCVPHLLKISTVIHTPKIANTLVYTQG